FTIQDNTRSKEYLNAKGGSDYSSGPPKVFQLGIYSSDDRNSASTTSSPPPEVDPVVPPENPPVGPPASPAPPLVPAPTGSRVAADCCKSTRAPRRSFIRFLSSSTSTSSLSF